MKAQDFIEKLVSFETYAGREFVETDDKTLTAAGDRAAMFVEELVKKGEKLHLKRWELRPNGQYRLIDFDADICLKMCYKLVGSTGYIVGNDAPRGGKQGWFICLTETGRKQLADVDFSELK